MECRDQFLCGPSAKYLFPNLIIYYDEIGFRFLAPCLSITADDGKVAHFGAAEPILKDPRLYLLGLLIFDNIVWCARHSSKQNQRQSGKFANAKAERDCSIEGLAKHLSYYTPSAFLESQASSSTAHHDHCSESRSGGPNASHSTVFHHFETVGLLLLGLELCLEFDEFGLEVE
jgi:hypothetical protein